METNQNSSRSHSSAKSKHRYRRLVLLPIGAVVVYVAVWFSRGPNLRPEGIASMTLSTYSPYYYCGEDGDNMYGTVSFEVAEDYRRRAIIAVMNDARRILPLWKFLPDGRVDIKYTDGKTVKVGLTGVYQYDGGASPGKLRVGRRFYQGLHMSMPELFALGGWDVAGTVAPLLVKSLQSNRLRERQLIAEKLLEFGEGAKVAVPALRELVNGPDQEAGVWAAFVLAKLDPGTELGVPVLAASLRDGDVPVRRSAASALYRLGPAAEGAIGELTKALDDEDEHVREVAKGALETIRREAGH